MTEERIHLNDMLTNIIDFETGLPAQISTLKFLNENVRARLKRSYYTIQNTESSQYKKDWERFFGFLA